jgi:beta-mannanase
MNKTTIYTIFLFSGLFFLLFGCENSRTSTSVQNLHFGKLLPPPENKIYFGAYADFGDAEDGVTLAKITDFENLAKKKIAWAYFSNQWAGGIHYPKEQIHLVYSAGKIPFIRLIPRIDNGSNEDHEDPVYKMQRFIDGAFDDELRAWARAAKEDTIPLLLDFAPEMTGFWMPWSGLNCGAGTTDGYGDPDYPDGPERYRDAYKHVIDIFRSENVQNVTWFFHPDIQRLPDEEWNSAKYYYPGDDYIDWIGLSIYGVQFQDEAWIYFSDSLQQYGKLIQEITNANKPIAVLEFGVTDGRSDGTKTAWFEDAFANIIDNPYFKISAISYWQESWVNPDGTKTTIKIDSSPESLSTFRRLIKNDIFISNCTFETLKE